MADPPASVAADPKDPTTTITKMVETAPAPQLSPLSGAYLLIVVGEPFSEEHKKLILQKIQQGLYTWNTGETHVNIENELNVISDCAPPGEEARGGERLIQFATENLVTEVLIHPQVNTLQQCMKNMLASFTKHRHIIHAGYTFAGQGSWILQDGTFTFEDFATAFEEYDVQRVIRSYENSISIHVHCCQEGDWKQDKIQQQPFAKLCQIEVNPNSEIKESNSVAEFISYLEPFLQPQSIQERLPPSDVVGNIRFSHPTLYVFPGGQGDSALFGINGFNMLIDGGFSRKACFWDFTRHLDRLDAILITRLSDENTQGISAVLERKSVNPVYPQIGHFFANILETKKDKEKEKQDEEGRDKLLVNVVQEGNTMIENLRILNLKPQICFRDNICDPINLYHKVGHGKLDMYVLNPSKESREVKEFLSRWGDDNSHLGKFKSGINVDGKELWLPIANLVSICALLIWQPANPNDTITRLLFPGSTPQNKIFKGLEKLRKLECLKYPACSTSTLKENKTNARSEKKKKMQKNDAKNMQPDNSSIERKEKLTKRRQEKLKKEKEEREKQEKEKKEEKEKRDKEKEEQEKIEKEKKDKERQEKLEKKKKVDKEKKDKERQERKEKEAIAKQDKEERLKKEAATKKDKEEKEAAAKKDREEKEAVIKKEKEEKVKKETANKKESSEQKNTEKIVKKETANKKESSEQKNTEKIVKKETANKKESSEMKNTEKIVKKKTSVAITKTKTKESVTKIKKTELTNDNVTSSRKIMPSKPLMTKSSTPPSSKLKKDENNKKVMETRKAAYAAKTQKTKTEGEEKPKSKKVVGIKTRNIPGSKASGKQTSLLVEEERKVDEKSVAEKVSEAIASGEIDDSRVVKDDDEDKESFVEKDQIEEMETCPVDDIEAGKDFVKDNEDDEDDIELQRIKDEDDDEMEENHAPVPDIAEKMADVVKDNNRKEDNQKAVPNNLLLEKEKISYSHVKTPDEVDDLPEHEVVAPDSHMMEEIKSEMSGDLEEKIALDESEKESDVYKKDVFPEKSDGSVEAVRDNEIVEVAIEQKCLQLTATTPMDEQLNEDDFKTIDIEPVFKEEKQYITTDKDEDVHIISEKKDLIPQNDKDASTEKNTDNKENNKDLRKNVIDKEQSSNVALSEKEGDSYKEDERKDTEEIESEFISKEGNNKEDVNQAVISKGNSGYEIKPVVKEISSPDEILKEQKQCKDEKQKQEEKPLKAEESQLPIVNTQTTNELTMEKESTDKKNEMEEIKIPTDKDESESSSEDDSDSSKSSDESKDDNSKTKETKEKITPVKEVESRANKDKIEAVDKILAKDSEPRVHDVEKKTSANEPVISDAKLKEAMLSEKEKGDKDPEKKNEDSCNIKVKAVEDDIPKDTVDAESNEDNDNLKVKPEEENQDNQDSKSPIEKLSEIIETVSNQNVTSKKVTTSEEDKQNKEAIPQPDQKEQSQDQKDFQKQAEIFTEKKSEKSKINIENSMNAKELPIETSEDNDKLADKKDSLNSQKISEPVKRKEKDEVKESIDVIESSPQFKEKDGEIKIESKFSQNEEVKNENEADKQSSAEDKSKKEVKEIDTEYTKKDIKDSQEHKQEIVPSSNKKEVQLEEKMSFKEDKSCINFEKNVAELKDSSEKDQIIPSSSQYKEKGGDIQIEPKLSQNEAVKAENVKDKQSSTVEKSKKGVEESDTEDKEKGIKDSQELELKLIPSSDKKVEQIEKKLSVKHSSEQDQIKAGNDEKDSSPKYKEKDSDIKIESKLSQNEEGKDENVKDKQSSTEEKSKKEVEEIDTEDTKKGIKDSQKLEQELVSSSDKKIDQIEEKLSVKDDVQKNVAEFKDSSKRVEKIGNNNETFSSFQDKEEDGEIKIESKLSQNKEVTEDKQSIAKDKSKKEVEEMDIEDTQKEIKDSQKLEKESVLLSDKKEDQLEGKLSFKKDESCNNVEKNVAESKDSSGQDQKIADNNKSPEEEIPLNDEKGPELQHKDDKSKDRNDSSIKTKNVEDEKIEKPTVKSEKESLIDQKESNEIVKYKENEFLKTKQKEEQHKDEKDSVIEINIVKKESTLIVEKENLIVEKKVPDTEQKELADEKDSSLEIQQKTDKSSIEKDTKSAAPLNEKENTEIVEDKDYKSLENEGKNKQQKEELDSSKEMDKNKKSSDVKEQKDTEVVNAFKTEDSKEKLLDVIDSSFEPKEEKKDEFSERKRSIDTDIVSFGNQSNEITKVLKETEGACGKEEPMSSETKLVESQISQNKENKFMPGVLEITVHRASELVNNDNIGKSDPYVKVTFIKEEFRSKTINNSLEPEWNFSCKFDILTLEEKYIHVNVYDDDFGKDNIEGCYSLSVKEAIQDLVEEGKWFNLVGCKTGKVFISTKYTKVKMEDSSTEKPVQKDTTKDTDAETFEKAEKIVGDIVQKAEKVIGEVQAKLNETESTAAQSIASNEENIKIPKEEPEHTSDEKEDEFVKISKESEEIIQKMEKTFVESQSVKESVIKEETVILEKKEVSLTLQNVTKTDSFQEIEKESKEIVSKLEKSFESSGDLKETQIENDNIVIKPGFLKVIVFEASELVNKDKIGKSDPFVKIKFRDQEFKSRTVKNTLEPEWNFSANLVITSSTENDDIVMEVYDDDIKKSDEHLGSYTFSLKQAISETDKEAAWYDLGGCKSGKIFLSTIYSPDEEEETEEKSSSETSNENKEDNLSSIQETTKDSKEDLNAQDSFIKNISPDGKQEEKNSSKEKDESEEMMKGKSKNDTDDMKQKDSYKTEEVEKTDFDTNLQSSKSTDTQKSEKISKQEEADESTSKEKNEQKMEPDLSNKTDILSSNQEVVSSNIKDEKVPNIDPETEKSFSKSIDEINSIDANKDNKPKFDMEKEKALQLEKEETPSDEDKEIKTSASDPKQLESKENDNEDKNKLIVNKKEQEFSLNETAALEIVKASEEFDEKPSEQKQKDSVLSKDVSSNNEKISVDKKDADNINVQMDSDSLRTSNLSSNDEKPTSDKKEAEKNSEKRDSILSTDEKMSSNEQKMTSREKDAEKTSKQNDLVLATDDKVSFNDEKIPSNKKEMDEKTDQQDSVLSTDDKISLHDEKIPTEEKTTDQKDLALSTVEQEKSHELLKKEEQLIDVKDLIEIKVIEKESVQKESILIVNKKKLETEHTKNEQEYEKDCSAESKIKMEQASDEKETKDTRSLNGEKEKKEILEEKDNKVHKMEEKEIQQAEEEHSSSLAQNKNDEINSTDTKSSIPNKMLEKEETRTKMKDSLLDLEEKKKDESSEAPGLPETKYSTTQAYNKEETQVNEEYIFSESKFIESQSLQKEEFKFMPGVLEVTVQRASELVNNDKIGKSDPYVKVSFINEEFRSKTINNSLEPEWNFSCKFDVLNLEEKYIHINVYDDDFGKDNIEGCYSLSVKEAIQDLVKEGRWFNLVGCKTGKVFISTKYTPKMDDSSTEKQNQKDTTKDKDTENLEMSEKVVKNIVQKASTDKKESNNDKVTLEKVLSKDDFNQETESGDVAVSLKEENVIEIKKEESGTKSDSTEKNTFSESKEEEKSEDDTIKVETNDVSLKQVVTIMTKEENKNESIIKEVKSSVVVSEKEESHKFDDSNKNIFDDDKSRSSAEEATLKNQEILKVDSQKPSDLIHKDEIILVKEEIKITVESDSYDMDKKDVQSSITEDKLPTCDKGEQKPSAVFVKEEKLSEEEKEERIADKPCIQKDTNLLKEEKITKTEDTQSSLKSESLICKNEASDDIVSATANTFSLKENNILTDEKENSGLTVQVTSSIKTDSLDNLNNSDKNSSVSAAFIDDKISTEVKEDKNVTNEKEDSKNEKNLVNKVESSDESNKSENQKTGQLHDANESDKLKKENSLEHQKEASTTKVSKKDEKKDEKATTVSQEDQNKEEKATTVVYEDEKIPSVERNECKTTNESNIVYECSEEIKLESFETKNASDPKSALTSNEEISTFENKDIISKDETVVSDNEKHTETKDASSKNEETSPIASVIALQNVGSSVSDVEKPKEVENKKDILLGENKTTDEQSTVGDLSLKGGIDFKPTGSFETDADTEELLSEREKKISEVCEQDESRKYPSAEQKQDETSFDQEDVTLSTKEVSSKQENLGKHKEDKKYNESKSNSEETANDKEIYKEQEQNSLPTTTIEEQESSQSEKSFDKNDKDQGLSSSLNTILTPEDKQEISQVSKPLTNEIEEIGEIIEIAESKEQKKDTAPDSFINEIYTSLGKQNSSQIDEKSSIEKDIDEGNAPNSSINNIHTSSGKQGSSQIDEELSAENERAEDTAQDSFINDVKETLGQQSSPDKESEVSEFKSGALQIIVHKAADLVNKDLMGKSDPYVIVKYRDHQFRSKTINNTLKPEWNFTSEFDIVEIDDSPIDIEVYDEDYGKDSLEGSYSLTLDEAINDLVVKGKWYNLEGCKTGKIFISTIYVSKDDEEQEDQVEADQSSLTEKEDLNNLPPQIKKHPEKTSDKKEILKSSLEADSVLSTVEEKKLNKISGNSSDQKEGLESSLKSNAIQEKEDTEKMKVSPGQQETPKMQDMTNKSDSKLKSEDGDKINAGVLKITIHKASKLDNLDIIGKSDPFVKIKFNDLEFKSNSIRNTLEPEWNFSNDLIISNYQNKAIDITIYDKDIGRDDNQGSYSLPVEEAVENSDKGGLWYNLTGSKKGKVFISTSFASEVSDEVDGSSFINEEICDNDKKTLSVQQVTTSDSDKVDCEIPIIQKEGEKVDDIVEVDEDTDKQDDDISESDYSFITVADLSRKEDVSQSELDEQSKLETDDKEDNEKSRDETIIQKDDTNEKESPPIEQSKGFMASIKESVGGYFYGDKSKKEEIKEEEKESSDVQSSEKESEKLDSHVPREFLMQPSYEEVDGSSSSLTKKQPINLKDDNETILEEAEPSEETENETESKDPAEVKMSSIPSEAIKEDPVEVTMISCHSEAVKEDTEEESASPFASDTRTKEKSQPDISLPFSPTSVQPKESYPQSDKSCDDNEDEEKQDTEAVKEVKKVLNQGYKQQILEGTKGIETIINNLFVVLGELSKSVGCQKSITDIKNELESFKQASTKITKEMGSGVSEDKATEIGKNLSTLLFDVKQSVLESKKLREKHKSSSVQDEEFDKLLINCQEILMDLESITKKEEKSRTPPSTPEEFHDAKEAISASASFAEKKDVEVESIGKIKADVDDVDGSSLAKSQKKKDEDSSSKPETQVSFVTHQVKSFDHGKGDAAAQDEGETELNDDKECEVEESESTNVSSKANTEGIGKLRTKMIEETVSSESTIPQENGLTQTISQTVTHTITISDAPLPETNGEPNLETDKPSTLAPSTEAKLGQTEETIKVTTQTSTQSSVTNNFPSLDSSDTDGYHFATPPPTSLESDIQPCGIDIDTHKSDPLSLTSISEDIMISESKSFSSSSDYKVITEERSVSIEKYSSKNGHPLPDNLAVDSGTDDQMSSGTFSQDEISPRFADLPQQLNVEKKRAFSTSDAYKRSVSDTLHQDLKKTTKDRSLSMETRSTSMASDVSDQEIPPTTPRSDLTISPSYESQVKFMYGDNTEKASMENMDIMTQSIYVGSDGNDFDSEISSESHLSTVQTKQQKISCSEDSKVTTTLKEESTSVFESVVKLSENVSENILEETKTITKSTKMAVEESFVSLKEEAESNLDSEEKLLKDKDASDTKSVSNKESLKDASIEKSESVSTTVVSKESSVVVTKTDVRSYSDVLKSLDSKQETITTIDSEKEKKSSIGTEAATEVLKSESVFHLVDSKLDSSSDNKTKKLSYSEVLKSANSVDKKDNKDKEDPIADWGKPLGLPSPIRPGTPAKQPKKTEEESVDTNKIKDAIEPVWMDLAYVPHHGASNYANAEFFKRVRARYYVFSGVEPSKDVFNALLEAKKTWENKEQEVTIIPTYDTDVLGYWVAENEELLTELKIDLAPSASRCTINLQDHATSCAAYRLEF